MTSRGRKIADLACLQVDNQKKMNIVKNTPDSNQNNLQPEEYNQTLSGKFYSEIKSI